MPSWCHLYGVTPRGASYQQNTGESKGSTPSPTDAGTDRCGHALHIFDPQQDAGSWTLQRNARSILTAPRETGVPCEENR